VTPTLQLRQAHTVFAYNKFMDGEDLHNQFRAKYSVALKSGGSISLVLPQLCYSERSYYLQGHINQISKEEALQPVKSLGRNFFVHYLADFQKGNILLATSISDHWLTHSTFLVM
jgi:hypothetical protein